MEHIPYSNEKQSEAKVFALNPNVLAFVGDSVHSLQVRVTLADTSDAKTGELHKKAVGEVKAVHQAKLAEAIYPHLTEREEEVFKRARNTRLNSTAKNASITEYRMATAFEAVVGYLYLTGQNERLDEIFDIANGGRE